MKHIIFIFLIYSSKGFTQNNIFKAFLSPQKPCYYALNRNNPTSPYIITFNQDTINQFQELDKNVKYGRWVYFRKNDYVKKEGYYEWGMKQGYWKYYSKQNQLEKIIKFKNDQILEIINLKKNSKKFFNYKKAIDKWDFGESRFLEMGNCYSIE